MPLPTSHLSARFTSKKANLGFQFVSLVSAFLNCRTQRKEEGCGVVVQKGTEFTATFQVLWEPSPEANGRCSRRSKWEVWELLFIYDN
jgi:hypothetical protein